MRILELNQQALDHYQSRYPLSWAPGYLRERIGTDLVGHPTYSAGFAPPGPRSLLTHLTDLGATLEEALNRLHSSAPASAATAAPSTWTCSATG